MPVTTPNEDTVPYAGKLLVHAPPGAGSLSPMELPTHTCEGPEIAGGPAFTVTVVVTVQLLPSV